MPEATRQSTNKLQKLKAASSRGIQGKKGWKTYPPVQIYSGITQIVEYAAKQHVYTMSEANFSGFIL